MTVTANSRSKHIGVGITFAGTEFTMAPTTLFGSDTLTSVTLTSTGADAGAGDGDYPIVPNNPVVGSGLSNYALSFVNGNLHVNCNQQRAQYYGRRFHSGFDVSQRQADCI